ncbi:hypothetical protein Hanom_Chr17g01576901 [Helianthus anomalus]
MELQASEETLAEERRNWRVACENDNKKMFVARTKITNLEAHVEELKKSELTTKPNMKKPNRTESVKDRELAGKDAEIAELKRRLRKAQEGLEAEKQGMTPWRLICVLKNVTS